MHSVIHTLTQSIFQMNCFGLLNEFLQPVNNLCRFCHNEFFASYDCFFVSLCAIVDTCGAWKLASSNITTDIDSSFNRETIEVLHPL